MPEPKTCPECGAEADDQGRRFDGPSGAMFLGLHRRRKHGVAGTSGKDRNGTRARARDRAPKSAAPRPPSLKTDLRRMFRVVGTVVAVVDPYCGGVLIDHSEGFCDALARLAQEDPRIARWLKALSKAGPYGALVVAAGEMVIPIAAHHGLIAPEATVLIGVAPPPVRPAPAPFTEPTTDGSEPEAVRVEA